MTNDGVGEWVLHQAVVRWVVVRVLDPPERPARTSGGDDTRLIAIGVAGVELR